MKNKTVKFICLLLSVFIHARYTSGRGTDHPPCGYHRRIPHRDLRSGRYLAGESRSRSAPPLSDACDARDGARLF